MTDGPSAPLDLCDRSADVDRRPYRQLSDLDVVVMAAGVWVAAQLAVPLPIPVALGGLTVALIARRPVIVVVAVIALAGGLGNRAVQRFDPVDPARVVDLPVEVIGDPRPRGPATSAVIRLPDGRRVELLGYGSAGAAIARTTAGDRLGVTGSLRPLDDTPWTRSRHLVGRLGADRVTVAGGPSFGPGTIAAAVRDRVEAGSDAVPIEDRALYLGLVIGDDRDQPPEQRATFAAAGLAHLLAVSGQNVAFVVTVLSPVTDRLPRPTRVAGILVALVLFALVTRLEPSVLRATMMAGMATVATASGHRQSGVRLLGLAVTALVLIDPFLVWSIGFQLSVAASGGILVLGPAFERRLPGPRALAAPLSVTMAAQLAVLPILTARFGPVSAVSIPANLLAGWAAGLVMMWGLTAGVVAGVVGGPVGSVLQLPAVAALRWLDAVATGAVRVPAPVLDTVTVGIAIALLVAARLGRAVADDVTPNRASRALRSVAIVGVVALLFGAVPTTPDGPIRLDGGATFVPASPVTPSVLVIEPGPRRQLLDSIIAHRITRLDVLVVTGDGGADWTIGRAVAEIAPASLILAGPQHRLVGARRVTEPVEIDSLAGPLLIEPDGEGLVVTGSRGAGADADRSRGTGR